MKLSERLERWKIDWLAPPMNGLEEVKNREFTDILRDLRALEGETRLPDAVVKHVQQGYYDSLLVAFNPNTKRWRVDLSSRKRERHEQLQDALDTLARELEKNG